MASATEIVTTVSATKNVLTMSQSLTRSMINKLICEEGAFLQGSFFC